MDSQKYRLYMYTCLFKTALEVIISVYYCWYQISNPSRITFQVILSCASYSLESYLNIKECVV